MAGRRPPTYASPPALSGVVGRFPRRRTTAFAGIALVAVGGCADPPARSVGLGSAAPGETRAGLRRLDDRPARGAAAGANASPVLDAELARIAAVVLPDAADAAAVMQLDDGRLRLAHHWAIVSRRRMMPGSVMKIVTAAALADRDEDRPLTCTGVHRDENGTERPCWHQQGHGSLKLRTALAYSCNTWFYAQSAVLPPDDWLRVAGAFGLGQGWSDPNVARDQLPVRIPRSAQPDVFVGDHTSVRVTPLSLLRAVSVVATGGVRVEPYRPPAASSPATPTPLGRDALRLVAEGMTAAVDDGTLKDIVPRVAAAKTGTAKKFRASGTRGWVIGFVPRDAPKFAFVVVKAHGRGAADAGPAAAALTAVLAASRSLK